MEPGRPAEPTITRPSVGQVLHWRHWRDVKRIPGDVREYIERIWAPKIPKLYEQLFDAARNGEHVSEQALDILKTMTLMTPSLTPAGLRERMGVDIPGLPSDIDMSNVTTADLARLARKTLEEPLDHVARARKAKHAGAMRAKKKKIEQGEAVPDPNHHSRRRKSVHGNVHSATPPAEPEQT